MARDLDRVETALAEVAAGLAWPVTEVCLHLIAAPAKRLRPALALLAAQFGNRATSDLIPIAVAIEWLHTATLYHDDIADEAATRRNVTSVNTRWGNRAAALSGAFLFSRAIENLAAAGDEINTIASSAVGDVWRGQKEETESVFRLDIDEAAALAIVERKTATLYRLACQCGALVGGVATPQAVALAEYARALGIAFQLVDDILDLIGDACQLGKPAGADLRDGVYTLPILRALSTGAQAMRLRCILGAREMTPVQQREVLAIIAASDAVAYTLERMQAFLDQARAQLHYLPPTPATDSLLNLTHYVAARASVCNH